MKKYIKHNESYTRLYNIWKHIKKRCLYKNGEDYPNYGGRGIIICPEWTNDYTKFRDWSLNNGYKEDLTIDRIDNDLGYNPNNCQWILNSENAKKKRTTKLTLEIANEIRILYKTGDYTLKELGKMYNVNFRTISYIINNKIWVN